MRASLRVHSLGAADEIPKTCQVGDNPYLLCVGPSLARAAGDDGYDVCLGATGGCGLGVKLMGWQGSLEGEGWDSPQQHAAQLQLYRQMVNVDGRKVGLGRLGRGVYRKKSVERERTPMVAVAVLY